MKKKILSIFLLIAILILSSCSYSNGEVNNLRIYFKNNKLVNRGYAAAVYEDRIYYISNEQNEPGIYSMKMDSSDVRLEAKNPSITSFQIHNNRLYFVGLSNLYSQEASYTGFSSNEHALYEKDLEEGPYNALPSKYNPKSSVNIVSFYITSDDIILLLTGTREIHIYDIKNNSELLKDLKVVKLNFNYPISDELNIINKNYNRNKEIYFGELGNNIIVSSIDLQEIKGDKNTLYADDNLFLIDNITNEIIILNETNNLINNMEILYSNKNRIYLSYSDICEDLEGNFLDNVQFIVIDKGKFKIKNTFYIETLEEQESISYVTKKDNTIYLIADRWSKREARMLPLKKEKLIAVKLDANEGIVITEFFDGKRIIGIEDDFLIYIDNNAIYKAELNNNKIGEEHKICGMSKNSETNDYTIDYAGDWMFIYNIYGGFTSHYSVGCDPGQQLLYKINIKTGEVIENNIELDFSYLDIYRRRY